MSYLTPEESKKLRESGAMSFPGDPAPTRRVVFKKVIPMPPPPPVAEASPFSDLAINTALEALALAMEAERETTLAQFTPETVSHGGIRAGFNRAIEMTRAAKR